MKILYVKPESMPVEMLQGAVICADSDRDGNLQDYYQDNEDNFFSGL